MSEGRLVAGDGSSLPKAWQAQLGLTAAEARRRLVQHGRNELPASGGPSWLALLGSTLKEPMFGLLLACAFVYVLLGDAHEALVLASFICVVIVITIVQEWRTERALSALRHLTSPRALVIRGGEAVRIAGARGGRRRRDDPARGRPRGGRRDRPGLHRSGRSTSRC